MIPIAKLTLINKITMKTYEKSTLLFIASILIFLVSSAFTIVPIEKNKNMRVPIIDCYTCDNLTYDCKEATFCGLKQCEDISGCGIYGELCGECAGIPGEDH